MSDLVLEHSVPVPIKLKRIPRRIAEVVNLLVTGECKTIKAAAERTGMHPNYVSGALKKPEIQVFIERAARQTITNGLMRASARVNELVDAGSEHVSLDASKHVLAIAGIKPAQDAQVSVNIAIKAGYVIDLTDEPMKVIQGRLTAD
jgi:pantoate kinase